MTNELPFLCCYILQTVVLTDLHMQHRKKLLSLRSSHVGPCRALEHYLLKLTSGHQFHEFFQYALYVCMAFAFCSDLGLGERNNLTLRLK